MYFVHVTGLISSPLLHHQQRQKIYGDLLLKSIGDSTLTSPFSHYVMGATAGLTGASPVPAGSSPNAVAAALSASNLGAALPVGSLNPATAAAMYGAHPGGLLGNLSVSHPLLTAAAAAHHAANAAVSGGGSAHAKQLPPFMTAGTTGSGNFVASPLAAPIGVPSGTFQHLLASMSMSAAARVGGHVGNEQKEDTVTSSNQDVISETSNKGTPPPREAASPSCSRGSPPSCRGSPHAQSMRGSPPVVGVIQTQRGERGESPISPSMTSSSSPEIRNSPEVNEQRKSTSIAALRMRARQFEMQRIGQLSGHCNSAIPT